MILEVQQELARTGLVARSTAIRHGMTAEEVDRLARTGAWVRVWRGTYTTSELWESMDAYIGQPLVRARAASSHLRIAHALSHDSGALELGIAVLDAPSQPVHVTRPGVVGTRHEHQVTHHKAPYRPEQVVTRGHRAVLDPARTAMDIARSRGLAAGLVAADSALAAGTTRAQLRAAHEAMPCWPGVTIARRVADLADAGSDSAGESLTREVLLELGHRPQTQLGLTDDGRTVWCDLLVGRHVIEFDGRQKYDDVRVLWEEKLRQDFVQRFRLGLSRVVWADLVGPRRAQLARRLDEDIRATTSLWGSDVSDLAAYRPRQQRRRPPGPRILGPDGRWLV
jgi:hypothetical protein